MIQFNVNLGKDKVELTVDGETLTFPVFTVGDTATKMLEGIATQTGETKKSLLEIDSTVRSPIRAWWEEFLVKKD